jgi:hypothetical protein
LKNLLNYNVWLFESDQERNDFYKEELNPSFWKDDKFDPKIREKLLMIAKDFYSALKFPAKIRDIQLTGSLANYNWTDKSDFDVHVLVDFSEIDDNIELVKRAVDGARFMWNLRHNLKIKGFDVELYAQDIYEPHTASGLFSLLNNKWIRIPQYNPPEIDYKDVDKKFQGMVSDILSVENVVSTSDFSNASPEEIYTLAVKLKKKILEMRKEGLSRSGEFSVENLVFKKLRNEGYIEKIIELISKAYTNIYNE